MPRLYSVDLRERALLACEDVRGGCAEVARRFRVGVSTLHLWRKQARDDGRLAPLRMGRGPAPLPDRAGQGRAPPDQPLHDQQARAGSPRHQRPIPAHAQLQVSQFSRPVLSRTRRAAPFPPTPLPPQSARPRRPPQVAPPPSHSDRARHLGRGLIGPSACARAQAIPAGASRDMELWRTSALLL